MVKANKILKLLMLLALGTVISLQGCSKDAEPAPSETNNLEQLSFDNLGDVVQQVKDSGHYKFFPTMVAKGPEGTSEEHYGDNCIKCHSGVKILDDPNAKLADFFPGGKYEGQDTGLTCGVCHEFGGNQMVTLKNPGWDTCMTCHTNEGAPVLGQEVHHPQAEMIKGIGVGAVEDMPSWKYASLKDSSVSFACYDCHVTNEYKHDFMVPGVTVTHDETGTIRTGSTMDYDEFAKILNQEKCSTCHYEPEKTIDTLKEHQKEITEKLDFLKVIYDQWSTKIATMDPNDPMVTTFKEGATYYTYVAADGSKGVHNYELAKALLDQAMAKFSELK